MRNIKTIGKLFILVVLLLCNTRMATASAIPMDSIAMAEINAKFRLGRM